MKKAVLFVLILTMMFSTIIVASATTTTSVTVTATKLSTEKEVPIGKELPLKKGTIIRASSISLPNFGASLPNQSSYYNYRWSEKSDIIIVLKQDMTVLFDKGGFYTKSYKYLSTYLKVLKDKCGIVPTVSSVNPSTPVVYMDDITSAKIQIEREKQITLYLLQQKDQLSEEIEWVKESYKTLSANSDYASGIISAYTGSHRYFGNVTFVDSQIICGVTKTQPDKVSTLFSCDEYVNVSLSIPLGYYGLIKGKQDEKLTYGIITPGDYSFSLSGVVCIIKSDYIADAYNHFFPTKDFQDTYFLPIPTDVKIDGIG